MTLSNPKWFAILIEKTDRIHPGVPAMVTSKAKSVIFRSLLLFPNQINKSYLNGMLNKSSSFIIKCRVFFINNEIMYANTEISSLTSLKNEK